MAPDSQIAHYKLTDGAVKLLDFGLADVIGENASGEANSTTISPTQFRFSPNGNSWRTRRSNPEAHRYSWHPPPSTKSARSLSMAARLRWNLIRGQS
jgi:hypothetical protein